MNQEKIGKFIAENRKKQDLTQEQLANKLGITKNAVSKWERGLNSPDVSLMKELCEVLDITLNELFEGKKLTSNEIVKQAENNIMNILMTKNQLETMQIFTEILILMGIIITITLEAVLTKTVVEQIIVMLIGTFTWGFGIFLRIKIRKVLINFNK